VPESGESCSARCGDAGCPGATHGKSQLWTGPEADPVELIASNYRSTYPLAGAVRVGSVDHQQRETGLVALQAAVLARRIFLPATRRSDLGPEQWQILMAIALAECTAAGELPSGSVESLAVQLSLDRDHVHALLFSLHARDYLAAVDDEQAEDEAEMPRFTLSPKGHAAVDRYLKRAARFLPGWPPARAN
jgi:DNA-binding MarR family transcriptional regulator